MKRFISIVLLILFAFNIAGYYFVLWGFRHHAGMELTARLDAELYTEEEIIELKVPVTIPYPLQEQGFQRLAGKFEHHGQYYSLVKQKLENDTLYIVCIRDKAEQKFAKAFQDFVKLSNDLPLSGKKAIGFLTKLTKDFQQNPVTPIIQQHGWSSEIPLTAFRFRNSSFTSSITSPPPEVQG